MSDTLPHPNALTATDIVEWLKAHPDFLKKHPDVIDFLLPPKEENGRKVADFQTYMIERLKADKTEAVETAKEMIETARNNMNNQSRIHAAVLRVLEAQSFDELVQVITSDLTAMLDVDITTIVLETDGREIPHIHTEGVRIVPEGTIDNWMRGKNTLLQSDISGIEAIYGSGATLVRSQNLVRVDATFALPPSLIAFGSRDPHLFHPNQGTEQAQFLARAIERQFRTWLTR